MTELRIKWRAEKEEDLFRIYGDCRTCRRVAPLGFFRLIRLFRNQREKSMGKYLNMIRKMEEAGSPVPDMTTDNELAMEREAIRAKADRDNEINELNEKRPTVRV